MPSPAAAGLYNMPTTRLALPFLPFLLLRTVAGQALETRPGMNGYCVSADAEQLPNIHTRHDYDGGHTTLEECAQECGRRGACVGYTYSPSFQGSSCVVWFVSKASRDAAVASFPGWRGDLTDGGATCTGSCAQGEGWEREMRTTIGTTCSEGCSVALESVNACCTERELTCYPGNPVVCDSHSERCDDLGAAACAETEPCVLCSLGLDGQPLETRSSEVTNVGHRPSISHNAARAECEARGQTLCASADLCPGGTPFDGGVADSSDTWVPVVGGVDEWLQYGANANSWQPGPLCSLHSVQYAPDPHPCHTHPDPEPYPDVGGCEHSHVYCCGVGLTPFCADATLCADAFPNSTTGHGVCEAKLRAR